MEESFPHPGIHEVHQESGEEDPDSIQRNRHGNGREDQQDPHETGLEPEPGREHRNAEKRGQGAQPAARFDDVQFRLTDLNLIPLRMGRNAHGL
jgi:hypothetical protein